MTTPDMMAYYLKQIADIINDTENLEEWQMVVTDEMKGIAYDQIKEVLKGAKL